MVGVAGLAVLGMTATLAGAQTDAVREKPAGVKHFDERRERPSKRMLTVDEEQQILDAAPPHLRVAIVLLVQTGGRTYSEGFSLRWEQMDLENFLIHLGGDVKTSESAQPVPLS
jgi:integrase